MGNVIKTIPNSDGAEVRVVISDKNWLESEAIDQLKRTAQLPGMKLGVGMPDLHPGKGQPIGAAFVTENMVYPHLVGSDIGCGMGLWKLDVTRRKVKVDKWEKKLTGLDDAWEGEMKPWLEAHGHHEVLAMLDDGDEPAMKNGLSQVLITEQLNKLGTIGGGNHFAEIQVIEQIFHEQNFEGAGLDRDSVVLLVHSGSRGVGQHILRNHVDHMGAKGLAGELAHDYLSAHDLAIKWAEANRALIAKRFSDKLNLSAEDILDVNHNTVERLDKESKSVLGLQMSESDCWIHRKGVSPTHSDLVIIPGSRGALSYLVKPTSDRATLAGGGFSLAHGAGRKWKRSDVKGRLQKRYGPKDLEVTPLGNRVVCKSKDLLYEEAPQAYKNIDLVVEDLRQAGLIQLVASFKPVLTYKTRRK